MSTTINQIGIPLSGSTGSGLITGATGPTMSNINVDNINISNNTISSINSNGNITISPNGTGSILMPKTTGVYIGPQNTNVGSVSPAPLLTLSITNAGASSEIVCWGGNAARAANMQLYKSRSTTVGTFSAVQSGDTIAQFQAFGDNGSAWTPSAVITIKADAAVSGGFVPGLMVLQTSNNSTGLESALTIDSSQVSTFSSTVIAPTVRPGNLSLTGNTLSSTNSDGDIFITMNAASGLATTVVGASTVPDSGENNILDVVGFYNGTSVYGEGLGIFAYQSENNGGALINFYLSSSLVIGTHATVSDGDAIGGILMKADNGTTFLECGSLLFNVVGTPGVSGIGCSSEWMVTDSSGANAGSIELTPDNIAHFSGIIYAKGMDVQSKGSGTEATNLVTAQGYAGVITTSSLTVTGGTSYAITWTNSSIVATSVVTLSVLGGSNANQNISFTVVPGSGSAVLTIYNNSVATSISGTILIGYVVF